MYIAIKIFICILSVCLFLVSTRKKFKKKLVFIIKVYIVINNICMYTFRMFILTISIKKINKSVHSNKKIRMYTLSVFILSINMKKV